MFKKRKKSSNSKGGERERGGEGVFINGNWDSDGVEEYPTETQEEEKEN